MKKKRLTGPLASGGVSAGRAATLLDVEATTSTSHTQRVTLVPPLTKTPCSLCLYYSTKKTSHNQHQNMVLEQ